MHKDVGGGGTKSGNKTVVGVGGVGSATLTSISSINNSTNSSRTKNNSSVPNEVSQKFILYKKPLNVSHSQTMMRF